MKVEIWSDVVCPWCYVGKRRFEAALARFDHRDAVEVEWRSFELDPTTASDDGSGTTTYAQRLGAKYGRTEAQAQQMLDSMTATAAAEGLEFRFDLAHHANTVDAHQVIHLARAHGLQDAMKERLLRAYFTEGAAVHDRVVLAGLAGEVGLDPLEVTRALDEHRFAADVRADEAEAAALGIRGVPFFVIDRAYGVSGAQTADVLLEALDTAWAASHPLTMVAAGGTSPDGDVCGPDGCA